MYITVTVSKTFVYSAHPEITNGYGLHFPYFLGIHVVSVLISFKNVLNHTEK